MSKIFKSFLSVSLAQLVKARDAEQNVVGSTLHRHHFISEDTKDLSELQNKICVTGKREVFRGSESMCW